ncbi:hypothetical protein AD998_05285 [bacterium 336/3]|nr:hypothetical protein AD998_05285 [bacterium 336/3]
MITKQKGEIFKNFAFFIFSFFQEKIRFLKMSSIKKNLIKNLTLGNLFSKKNIIFDNYIP